MLRRHSVLCCYVYNFAMSSTPNIGPGTTGRILAIDLARVFAIVFMIQGHTLDVLLAPQYRQGFFFEFWLFLRGLTAPMFLVLAGASFAVVTMRSWDFTRIRSRKALLRVARFTGFIFIGYLMRMPARSFSDLQFVDSAAFLGWFQVDVLQCVGASLLGLQLLLLFAKSARQFAAAAVATGCLIAISTPFLWAVEWSGHLPSVLAAYLNGNTGSLFPLFPWAAYLFVGIAVGYIYATRESKLSVRVLAVSGVAMVLAGIALQKIPISLYGTIDFWKTSPNLFLVRVGGVCMLLATIGVGLRWIAAPRFLSKTLARESLIAYLVHVCILYGSSRNAGLRESIGATLTPAYTAVAFGLLLVISAGIAISWHWCKHSLPGLSREAAYAALALLKSES